jgi:beta-fructofuranosidase
MSKSPGNAIGDWTRRSLAQAAAAGALSAQIRPNPLVVKAMDSVLAAIPKAESDPARPVYHFHPPAQWNNDPNGTLFYKGWHHLFYQLNPYGSTWGHMHWGHARSRDLVNWEHLPIALWPSVEKGEEHVFSGGAILAEDGRPRLFYTSIGSRPPEQWMALPADDDLLVWEKYPRNPVLDIKIHGDRTVADWRDPFLFQAAGKTYMVCGGNLNGRRRGGSAAVQLYEAAGTDLAEWKYRGVVFEHRDQDVINIECPNLFKLGSKWVLLVSPHRPCEFFVGDLDLSRGKFLPETHGILDAGGAYATNISRDPQGRMILWAWGRTKTDPEKGWNSCMLMPRILTIGDSGFLRQIPAPEFESLREGVRTVEATALGEKPIVLGKGDCLEMQLELSAKTAAAVGLRVRGKTEISFNPKDGMLTVGKVKKMLGTGQPVTLRVFLDRSVVEVYANGGEVAIFTAIDAPPSELGIEAFARGGAGRLEKFRLWPLKPASFSLEHFKI